jgi:hypothetical protein
MKKGRPSKFDSINLEQIKKLYLSHWTDRQVADFFGVSEQTINAWKKKNGFLESIKEWKKTADEEVERSLYERATGYSHPSEEVFCSFGKVTKVPIIKHYPPSEVACIFWLKNRQPAKWRDKILEEAPEDLINRELTFDDIPSNGDGMHRFKDFLHK